MTTDTHLSGKRRRKIQAVLAGGVVLGLGAALTLANWTAGQFAWGNFGAAGELSAESNSTPFGSDGGAFRHDSWFDHYSAENAAELQLDVAGINNNWSDTARFGIRLAEDSESLSGEITNITVESSGINAEHISYELYQMPPMTSPEMASEEFSHSLACRNPQDIVDGGGQLVAQGDSLNEGLAEEDGLPDLDFSLIFVDDGAPVSQWNSRIQHFCFYFEASDSLIPAGQAQATWQFHVESQTADSE
ncbi:hypothetical protein [Nesterenkonia ebinurensis]|uniref:hypothetical protein n=1 Tax=Nesterenkonia ebinurensis TaxID=2608252 RepID=UPI00123D260B|nr:hypothetical protein [Nesterenkonia ebinurensis]